MRNLRQGLRVRLLLLFFALFFLMGCASNNSAEYRMKHPSASKVYVQLPKFGPDNDTIIFSYVTVFESKLATYNLKTGEIRKLATPGIKHCYGAQYSRDGKRIFFMGSSDEWHGETSFSIMNRNYYVMNADGTGLKQLSHFPPNKRKHGEPGEVKVVGSFSLSPDERRIIYYCGIIQRGKTPPLKGTMISWWDVYEMDIETGMERRLTNYFFHKQMSQPHYLSDGKRFVFSLAKPINTGDPDFNYESKYKKNYIFIMDGKNNELKPAFTYGMHSYLCTVSIDDAILFVAQTNELDNKPVEPSLYDLFLRKKDGSILRLTNLQEDIAYGYISPDGSRILFNKYTGWSIWMINSDGTGLREVVIPMEKLGKQKER